MVIIIILNALVQPLRRDQCRSTNQYSFITYIMTCLRFLLIEPFGKCRRICYRSIEVVWEVGKRLLVQEHHVISWRMSVFILYSHALISLQTRIVFLSFIVLFFANNLEISLSISNTFQHKYVIICYDMKEYIIQFYPNLDIQILAHDGPLWRNNLINFNLLNKNTFLFTVHYSKASYIQHCHQMKIFSCTSTFLISWMNVWMSSHVQGLKSIKNMFIEEKGIWSSYVA